MFDNIFKTKKRIILLIICFFGSLIILNYTAITSLGKLMSYNEILDEEWIFVDSYKINEKSDSLMLADFKSLKTGKFLYAVPYYKFGSNNAWDLKIKLHNQKKEKFILKLTKKQLDRAKNRKFIKNSTAEIPFLVFVILLIFVTPANVMLINFYYCRIVEEKNNYEELLKKK